MRLKSLNGELVDGEVYWHCSGIVVNDNILWG